MSIMILARVIGNIEATHKYYQYEGLKMLYVQKLDLELEPMGDPFIAVDSVDAGEGDIVLIMLEGWSAWQSVGKKKAPVNRAVVGVIDRIDLF